MLMKMKIMLRVFDIVSLIFLFDEGRKEHLRLESKPEHTNVAVEMVHALVPSNGLFVLLRATLSFVHMMYVPCLVSFTGIIGY